MGISAKILQDTLVRFERRLAVDIPILLIQAGQELLESGLIREIFLCASESQLRVSEVAQEFALEFFRHDLDRQEKLLAANYPSALFGKPASRHNHVNMGMKRKILSPGVIPTSG